MPAQATTSLRHGGLDGFAGEPIAHLNKKVTAIAFAPDGTLFASDNSGRVARFRVGASSSVVPDPDATTHSATAKVLAVSFDGHRRVSDDDDDGIALVVDLTADVPVITLPKLRSIYLSACKSAHLRGEQDKEAALPPHSESLAEAMLRSGVSALVDTFFGVADGPAGHFASAVYAQIAAGRHPLARVVLVSAARAPSLAMAGGTLCDVARNGRGVARRDGPAPVHRDEFVGRRDLDMIST